MANFQTLNGTVGYGTGRISMSMLDGSNNPVAATNGYIGMAAPTFNNGTVVSNTGGTVTYESPWFGRTGNIYQFNDSTPAIDSDDFFSGIRFDFDPGTPGIHDTTQVIRLSFDGQILAQNVPEPSTFIICGISCFAFLFKRSRKGNPRY